MKKELKSWQWLFYLYILLPVALFLLALISKSVAFGQLFHSYNLYCILPIPDFNSFTGILGILLPLWFLWSAFRRKDKMDLLLSIMLVLANMLYFYYEVNYILIKFIKLA